MASERTVLRIMGKALWDTRPTQTDLASRQLAVALGYPLGWRVVRNIETDLADDAKKIIVDRIHAGRPDTGCDMWFHHVAAMQASAAWVAGESTGFDQKGGHLLPRLALFKKGDKVQVWYAEEWWDAKVLRRKEDADSFRYQVQYGADNSKQSGVDEDLIQAREAKAAKPPSKTALEIGLGEEWEAVCTSGNRWKITGPGGELFKSKKAALEVYAKIASSEKEMADGDPPWRTTGNDLLGRRVRWSTDHAVSTRRSVTVEQNGTVKGYIGETDVDQAGEPGFVSDRTGKPARLFHIFFDDEPHHPYASFLVQSQDLEEYEVMDCLLPEETQQASAKKKARKR